jgi:multisubunit Na+/H+ antiporter MnhF subunit
VSIQAWSAIPKKVIEWFAILLISLLSYCSTVMIASWLNSGSAQHVRDSVTTLLLTWALSLFAPGLFLMPIPLREEEIDYFAGVKAIACAGSLHFLFLLGHLSLLGYYVHATAYSALVTFLLVSKTDRVAHAMLIGQGLAWSSLLPLAPILLDHLPLRYARHPFSESSAYVALILALLSSVLMTLAAKKLIDNRRNPTSDLPTCLHCGYCLHENMSGRCPECGTPIELDEKLNR